VVEHGLSTGAGRAGGGGGGGAGHGEQQTEPDAALQLPPRPRLEPQAPASRPVRLPRRLRPPADRHHPFTRRQIQIQIPLPEHLPAFPLPRPPIGPRPTQPPGTPLPLPGTPDIASQ
ncbi:hypothetical protein DAEQUDRAFT_765571, partial [Daedalea quercina L-15889]